MSGQEQNDMRGGGEGDMMIDSLIASAQAEIENQPQVSDVRTINRWMDGWIDGLMD